MNATSVTLFEAILTLFEGKSGRKRKYRPYINTGLHQFWDKDTFGSL